MNVRALLKYYIDVNIFTIIFSSFFGYSFGLIYGMVLFSTVGLVIGFIGFHAFKSHEYYMYHNLGFSKRSLMKKVWLINSSITVVVCLTHILIF